MREVARLLTRADLHEINLDAMFRVDLAQCFIKLFAVSLMGEYLRHARSWRVAQQPPLKLADEDEDDGFDSFPADGYA